MNSGLMQLSHVQHLVGLQLFLGFMALNAGLFFMSCHLYPSRLPVKGWLVISYFIILLGPKNRVRNAERKSFLLSFSIFGQG